MPARDELPSTLQRSPRKAQQIWGKAHDAAAEQYGDGEVAHRIAFAALKHGFEKVGDHWEPKDRRGPSDARASRRRPDLSRRAPGSAGGVDANASKKHLLEVARRLEVPGRSRMNKADLVRAIESANERDTRRAREKESKR